MPGPRRAQHRSRLVFHRIRELRERIGEVGHLDRHPGGIAALLGGPGEGLRQTSGQLLQHLSLLFVPAGTGIVLYGDRIAAEWLPLLVALFLSTFLAIAVTALVLKALTRNRARTAAEREQ